MSIQNIRTAKDLKATIESWKNEGLKIGFIPTMGALHAGHLSLVRIAKAHADKVVVSIFVNPTQFSPDEDFPSYPRDISGDLQKLEAEGVVDLVYTPTEEEIYPDGYETEVEPGRAAEGLESDFRPDFFRGVVNIVYRLLEQVNPDVVVFGEKDYQQLQVIHELVAANDMWVDVLAGPIVRDEHGLALSSRNAYLKPHELEIARKLNKILQKPEAHKEALRAAGFTGVDYVEERWGRRLAAVRIGTNRLIDNVPVESD